MFNWGIMYAWFYGNSEFLVEPVGKTFVLASSQIEAIDKIKAELLPKKQDGWELEIYVLALQATTQNNHEFEKFMRENKAAMVNANETNAPRLCENFYKPMKIALHPPLTPKQKAEKRKKNQ